MTTPWRFYWIVLVGINTELKQAAKRMFYTNLLGLIGGFFDLLFLISVQQQISDILFFVIKFLLNMRGRQFPGISSGVHCPIRNAKSLFHLFGSHPFGQKIFFVARLRSFKSSFSFLTSLVISIFSSFSGSLSFALLSAICWRKIDKRSFSFSFSWLSQSEDLKSVVFIVWIFLK